jgi:hypothetical protein
MKQILLILTVVTNLFLRAQEIDTAKTKAASSDSLKISDMVQLQIQQAMEKETKASKESVPLPVKTISAAAAENKAGLVEMIYNYLSAQPLYIKLFSVISMMIILFVLGRRLLIGIQNRTLSKLKARIQLLRDEKVRPKVDPKMQSLRIGLRENETLFNKSDKYLSRKARDLNISKGELLLAARLKLFEVGRM